MKKHIITIVLLALSGLTAHAQSCDARYPMGVWQTHLDENEAIPKLFVNVTFFRKSGCCGEITITDYKTDEEEFSGDLYYAGKEIKNGMPTGTYYFDVKTEVGKTSRISVNASREPMIIGTGELKDHPAFKHHISWIPGALGGTGGELFAQYCESEKELLEQLRLYLKDRRIPVDGFGNIQQYINTHAKLDPNKPKFAKPKGASAINIRNGRSTTAAKVGELKSGQMLLVLDEFDGWCQVAISDKESGWVSLSVVTLTNTYVAPSSTTTINRDANAQKTDGASPQAKQNDVPQFVVAKGKGAVNIRKAPNTKAVKIDSMEEDQTFPVVKEQDGWYEIRLNNGKTGWVSKTVCRISEGILDISKVSDHLYGVSESYEDYLGWCVAQVEGTDWVVCVTIGCNMYQPLGDTGSHLWLGKKIGNTLVFDQSIAFSARHVSGAPDKFVIERATWTDEYGFDVYYGDNHATPKDFGFRPSSLTKQEIERLFNGKQNKGKYLFIGPELFASKYANVEFG